MKSYTVTAQVEVTIKAPDAELAEEWVEQHIVLSTPLGPAEIDDVNVTSIKEDK